MEPQMSTKPASATAKKRRSRWRQQSRKDLMAALILAIVSLGFLLNPTIIIWVWIPLVSCGVLLVRGYFDE